MSGGALAPAQRCLSARGPAVSCACPHRLARFLRRTKGPNEVEEEVLSDFISTACFVLEPPRGCADGEQQPK